MSDILTGAPKYGDSNNVLLLKLAKSLQDKAGVTPDGSMEREPVQDGDFDNTLLLKAAYAAQQL